MFSSANEINFIGKPIYGRGELILEPYCYDLYDASHTTDLVAYLLKIIDKVEWHRCEGRLMPADLFDKLDNFRVLEKSAGNEDIAKLIALAGELGEYYQLNDSDPIDVGHWWPPNPAH